ncbi:TetR/AcrR family transcriptional regulator [Terricaulis sp.]|uniref:TetR/AcrR family transcriptional regulator n=1 Tax=Terricaulis sp. TaxID=2768686 RepID=UPI003784AF05
MSRIEIHPGAIDKRVARTRALLSQALLDLGAEHGVDAIDVGDLIESAGIGRSTFYAHYTSKQDFLCAAFVNLIAGMERLAAAREPERQDLLPSRYIFAHIEEARDFATKTARSEAQPRLLAAGEAKLRAIAEENLARLKPDWTAERRREAAVFVAAGFVGMLHWWMLGGVKQSAAKMQAAFERLSNGILNES